MTHRGDGAGAAGAGRGARRYAPYVVVAIAVVLVAALIVAGQGLSGGHPQAAPVAVPTAGASLTQPPTPLPGTGSPSVTGSSTRSPSRSPSAHPVSGTPSATPSPTPTMPGPPTSARTVQIVGPGGLCLDDNGATSQDHNKIQMWGCNTTPAQRFTLATDGTLQVVGRCLRIADSGANVELFTCNAGAGAQQWRALSSRALVNAASGPNWRCITNPGASQQPGAQIVVTSCPTPFTTVNGDQQWQLS